MASVDEVQRKLEELIERLHGSDDELKASLRDSLPEARILHLHVTDLEADFWTELVDGHMGALHRGSPDEAHARIETDSDHFIDMVDGRLHLVSAFLSGKVRVDASFGDMMQLRKML
ncbi:MAG TPA: SCP2 sterol-binding domain-containing protein [Actinomycetota bacterium]|nr:SCP2 sterol-binding domain-containing protein [Actinomycetota bacterium]